MLNETFSVIFKHCASGLSLNIRPHLRERGKKMLLPRHSTEELFAQYATALVGMTGNPRFSIFICHLGTVFEK